ncbi:NAD(P)/FAD-dependent oxidoreductase [Mycobacterium cookii]|uniref:NAD(P)/FAD-dependent oxidoreductase n=2 Tax=Nocardioides furvisabuli TaxID=375542 RepID=A0ABN2WZ33_9ACTN
MTVRLPVSGTPVRVDFDPDQTRRRFAEQRDKRLKREPLGQFQGLSDVLELEYVDRFADPVVRDALIEDVEVAILGGGFGGLCAGARLTEQGVTDFRIIEHGGDFGGTWYWNRYPGVQCDVESHIYMPLLDETGYVPSKRYADGDEIFEHAQRIGRHFDLYRTALFQTTVIATEWQADVARWEVRTDRGDVIRARFLLRSNGPLSKPQVPRLPGINDFRGKIFHTSRWDYDYTGGDQHGGLENLRDKRVAIVGTGATAIQAVPYLAEYAKELLVVQRTPSTVGVRANKPTDPAWAADLEPGWQADRIHNFNNVVNGHDPDENFVGDFWTEVFPNATGRKLVDVPPASLPLEDQMALAEIADMNATHAIHDRINGIVEDPNTAEGLKPWYGFLCKRPVFNDEYYPAFNRPTVKLVSAPGGIEGITGTGLVVDGTAYDVDLIIFATGFETGSSTSSRYGYDIIGRDGLSLADHFADGTKTLHGQFTHGFPNFLELGLSQNAYLVNYTYMLDRKAHHAARIIAHALDHGVSTIEPVLEAQDAWVETVRAAAQPHLHYVSTCTPGYYSGQGDISRAFFTDVYRISEVDYWNMIDRWWAAGTFEGLTLHTPATANLAARP